MPIMLIVHAHNPIYLEGGVKKTKTQEFSLGKVRKISSQKKKNKNRPIL
jgi:hypothetical protein